MNFDRYIRATFPLPTDRGFTRVCFTMFDPTRLFASIFFIVFCALVPQTAISESAQPDSQTSQQADAALSENRKSPQNDLFAKKLMRRVVFQLASGPAFESKVRQRVWAFGREVVGVGTYEQSGQGSGQFNFQMTMHDGEGKHSLQQISDGRLAWTRTEIAEALSLKRVDVARLDEWTESVSTGDQLPPRLRVGGWIEMLESIERDYELSVASGKLQGQAIWMVTGRLSETKRSAIQSSSGRNEWPPLYPIEVHVVISKTGNKETDFGKFMPLRIEYLGKPKVTNVTTSEESSEASSGGRLISLVELYSIRQIMPPPIERFRYENRDAEVNFINETDRYLVQFGVSP